MNQLLLLLCLHGIPGQQIACTITGGQIVNETGIHQYEQTVSTKLMGYAKKNISEQIAGFSAIGYEAYQTFQRKEVHFTTRSFFCSSVTFTAWSNKTGLSLGWHF